MKSQNAQLSPYLKLRVKKAKQRNFAVKRKSGTQGQQVEYNSYADPHM